MKAKVATKKKSNPRTDSSPSPATIKKARERAGLSPREAAELIGYTRQAWGNWERGDRKMRSSLYTDFLRLTRKGDSGGEKCFYA